METCLGSNFACRHPTGRDLPASWFCPMSLSARLNVTLSTTTTRHLHGPKGHDAMLHRTYTHAEAFSSSFLGYVHSVYRFASDLSSVDGLHFNAISLEDLSPGSLWLPAALLLHPGPPPVPSGLFRYQPDICCNGQRHGSGNSILGPGHFSPYRGVSGIKGRSCTSKLPRSVYVSGPCYTQLRPPRRVPSPGLTLALLVSPPPPGFRGIRPPRPSICRHGCMPTSSQT